MKLIENYEGKIHGVGAENIESLLIMLEFKKLMFFSFIRYTRGDSLVIENIEKSKDEFLIKERSRIFLDQANNLNCRNILFATGQDHHGSMEKLYKSKKYNFKIKFYSF